MAIKQNPNFLGNYKLNYSGDDPLAEAIYRINVGQYVGGNLAYQAFLKALSDESYPGKDVQIGVLLSGIMAKVPTEDEVIGLLKAAFSLDKFDYINKIKIKIPKQKKLVSIIGSGKKGYKTINISTASAIVASACGVYTAKPCSHSTSSMTGSFDIMEIVGMNVTKDVNRMIELLQKTKFGLFPIENIIPRFDKIYGGKFFAPHALSLALPALVCPLEVDTMLYGLAHPYVDLSVRIFHDLGIKNIMVTSTTDDGVHYIDEMGIWGTTTVMGIKDGVMGKLVNFKPSEIIDLPKFYPADIAQGISSEENAKIFIEILAGKSTLARESIVCINAGTLIYLTGEAKNLEEGFLIAKNIIKKGTALLKLKEIIIESKGSIRKLESYLI